MAALSSEGSPIKGSDFNFLIPASAPVFEPTWEEFQEPLVYINKIRPIAEKSGICKIKPPPDWQPPFAVDVDNFKFTPRIQRLNELEAKTRIKLNFLDQIAKFWELQGSSLKIPVVEKKSLDLFTLHHLVQEEGGKDTVTRERKWSKIASRMGYPSNKSVGTFLKSHYERVIYPFEVFPPNQEKEESAMSVDEDSDTGEKKDRDYTPHGIPYRQTVKPPQEKGRRSKRYGEVTPDGQIIELGSDCYPLDSKELRRLQFYGAGPKMAGYQKKQEEKLKTRGKKVKYDYDPLAKYVCHNCERGDSEEAMLLCDGCDDSYHTFCLTPPLGDIPKGDWRCPKCVAAEVSKPTEAFGFEQAQREYTLQQFGEMADQFKSEYFNRPVHLVPTDVVEKEFWRIVSSIDEDVTVEYGADLHTMDHGSGFPTKSSKNMLPGDEEYAVSNWNLNNLPVLEGSVLGHINADISGMKVPWMYVGMCFATFCWHNEDHWSYSINYLHWGEAKTWYGVPGSKAEEFESAMRTAAPELFQSQPDLLHQLVTIMNPNIIMARDVPVFRTDQHAGEFVVTFPRAYHAGFNQGYNFAEAVNFAPADWLTIGRECINHYSHLHRYCVFSHDELVCTMAMNANSLDLTIAAATYQDMLKMVETEKRLRKNILEWGVTQAEREAFELLPDDERQCEVCKTTCFLSAVTCKCNSKYLVCLKHYKKLCSCPPVDHTLRYRYTLDELPTMLQSLKTKAESFDTWANKVKEALDATGEDRLEMCELKELMLEADEKKFPSSDLVVAVTEALQEAEKCASVAQQLASKKVRTRTRQAGDAKFKLTVEEIQLFCEQLEQLVCRIREADAVKELLEKVLEFQDTSTKLLAESRPESKEIQECLEMGSGLDIEFPEIPLLKEKLLQMQWLEEVQDLVEDREELGLDILRRLISAGVSLPPYKTVESALGDLQILLTQAERWEEKAKLFLQSTPRHAISTLEAIMKEAEKIPAFLPNVAAMKDSLKKAKDWIAKYNFLQKCQPNPPLELVESLVVKGRPIPVRLDPLVLLQSQVEVAHDWTDKTSRTFLKKNTQYSLIEILSPRADVGVVLLRNKKRRIKEEHSAQQHQATLLDLRMDEAKNPSAVLEALKEAELKEVDAMKELRIQNLQKRASDIGNAKYCICRKGNLGFMLQCELCKDWFHATCVPLPKLGSLKNRLLSGTAVSGTSTSQLAAARDLKFLCPCCQRSRRPRLETILSLLVSLQKIPVLIPEGEALRCLTDRILRWQERTRLCMETSEMMMILSKMSTQNQRLQEVAVREKTERIISAELRRAAASGSHDIGNRHRDTNIENTDPALSLDVITSQGENSMGEISGTYSSNISPSNPQSPSTYSNGDNNENYHHNNNGTYTQSLRMDDDDSTGTTDAGPTCFSNLEHTYSAVSKSGSSCVNRKHSRKSPLVPRSLEPPILELTEMAKAQLEELMMEGDLMEVSLDETTHIWRILQAAKPKREDKLPDFEEIEQEIIAAKAEKDKMKERKRRRKEEECIGGGCKKLKVKIGGVKGGEDGKGKKKLKAKLNKQGSGVLAEQAKRVRKIKFKKKNEIEKKRMSRVKNKGKQVSDDDTEEDCSAEKCLKPTGMEVLWVQCDGGCDLWFHLICVGLASISAEEEYHCPKCRNEKTDDQSHDESRMESEMEEEETEVPIELLQPKIEATDGNAENPIEVYPNDGVTYLSSTADPQNYNTSYSRDMEIPLIIKSEKDGYESPSTF